MKTLIGMMIVLVAASVGYGTDFYVDAAAADDSGTGLIGSPEKTIAAAIADVAAAAAGEHIIYVKAGSYAPTTLGLNSVPDAETLTIEGYVTTPGDGHTVSLGASRPVIASTDATWLFYRTSTWAGSSFTLRNLVVPPASLTNDIIRWGSTTDNGPDANLTCEFCSFTPAAASTAGVFSAQTVAGMASTRVITFKDCTITGHATSTRMFSTQELGAIHLLNVDLVSGGTGSTAHYLTVGGSLCPVIDIENCDVGAIGGSFVSFGSDTASGVTSLSLIGNTGSGLGFCVNGSGANDATAIIGGNTWTGTGIAASIGVGQANVARTGTWNGVQIYGNTFAMTGTGAHGIMVGANCLGAEVYGNTCTITDVGSSTFGLVLKGAAHVHHNVIVARDALYLIGGSRSATSGSASVVHHNTFVGTAVAAFNWGLNTNTAYPSATGTNLDTDGSATVTVDASKDLSLVKPGDILQIGSTTHGLQGTNYYLITAVDDTAKTITVSPTPDNGDDNQTWYALLPAPFDASVTDNIFYGVACNAVYNSSGTHSRIRMDRNLLYRAGSGALANVEGDCADLAALQAKWGAGNWMDSYATNDDNSVSSDPLFVGATDYRVFYNSPAAPTHDPAARLTALGGIGAYLPIPAAKGETGVHAGRGSVTGETGEHSR